MSTHEEILQCYDANGCQTDIHPRSEVKKLPPRWWYGVVRIFLINNTGEIMCSKRAVTVSANPGKWQIFFGGHVDAGETFLRTAQREIEEEAGIQIQPDQLWLIAPEPELAAQVLAEKLVPALKQQASESQQRVALQVQTTCMRSP